jgi:hypothetical protein
LRLVGLEVGAQMNTPLQQQIEAISAPVEGMARRLAGIVALALVAIACLAAHPWLAALACAVAAALALAGVYLFITLLCLLAIRTSG